MDSIEEFSSVAKLTTIHVIPMVLKAAIELELLEIIARAGADAQLSPSQITSQLPTQNPTKTSNMVDRMLRLLASHSILTCTTTRLENGQVERHYGLAPLSRAMVRKEDGVSLSPPLMLVDKVVMESWYYLKDAVLDGELPFHKAHRLDLYEYSTMDERFNQLFNAAMYKRTLMFMKAVMETYKGFEEAWDDELIDVGGGNGTTLSIITSKYPSIKGINFDLPHVIQNVPSYPGIKHIGGDMFVRIPKGNNIFLKHVLHNWSDHHCSKILKNCHEALPDNGKVIVMEMAAPTTIETNDDVAQAYFQLDVVMMTQHEGGKERTDMEYQTLGEEAGFKKFELVCRTHIFWIMEFRK